MFEIELYQSAINFLLSFDPITKDVLNKYFEPKIKPKDIKKIYWRFCYSAQNKQMYNKVIGSSIGGVDNLKSVLFDYNPKKVAENYAKNGKINLLDEIIKVLKPSGQIRRTDKSIWPLFCQSVIESAYFLQTFQNANEFYKWADSFAKDSRSIPALPLMISLEITGIGFPLACDILKEIGYIQYGKPDVHIKDIFKALEIIDPLEKSTIKQDFATLKAIDNIAKSNNTSSYAVDHVFWLIGSGNFYLTNIRIGSQKKIFIDKFKKELKSHSGNKK